MTETLTITEPRPLSTLDQTFNESLSDWFDYYQSGQRDLFDPMADTRFESQLSSKIREQLPEELVTSHNVSVMVHGTRILAQNWEHNTRYTDAFNHALHSFAAMEEHQSVADTYCDIHEEYDDRGLPPGMAGYVLDLAELIAVGPRDPEETVGAQHFYNPLPRYERWLEPESAGSPEEHAEILEASDAVEKLWKGWKEGRVEPLHVLYHVYEMYEQYYQRHPEKTGNDHTAAFLFQTADAFAIEADIPENVQWSAREYIERKARAGVL